MSRFYLYERRCVQLNAAPPLYEVQRGGRDHLSLAKGRPKMTGLRDLSSEVSGPMTWVWIRTGLWSRCTSSGVFGPGSSPVMERRCTMGFPLDRSPRPGVGHSVRGRGGRGGARLRTRPSYTRLPGQDTTVSATRLRCSFSMGTSAEWLMPAVDRPLTATIMSPHLEDEARRRSDGREVHPGSRCGFGHSLEAAVVVGGRAQDDGLDEEGLVAVALLVAAHDAEAPAARVAPPQDDLVAAVQVAAGGGPQCTTRVSTLAVLCFQLHWILLLAVSTVSEELTVLIGPFCGFCCCVCSLSVSV